MEQYDRASGLCFGQEGNVETDVHRNEGENDGEKERLAVIASQLHRGGGRNDEKRGDDQCADGSGSRGDGDGRQKCEEKVDRIGRNSRKPRGGLVECEVEKLAVKEAEQKKYDGGQDQHETQFKRRDGDETAEKVALKVCRVCYETGQDARQPDPEGEDQSNGQVGELRVAFPKEFDPESGKNTVDRGTKSRIESEKQSERYSCQRRVCERLADHRKALQYDRQPDARNDDRQKGPDEERIAQKIVLKNFQESIHFVAFEGTVSLRKVLEIPPRKIWGPNQKPRSALFFR